MFYLIETKNQLNQLELKLSSSLSRYLEFIQGNDNTHPALAEIIAVYLDVDGEDFIIPLNHLECKNWDKDAILNVLAKYEFCVLDKKAALHAATHFLYGYTTFNTFIRPTYNQCTPMVLSKIPTY